MYLDKNLEVLSHLQIHYYPEIIQKIKKTSQHKIIIENSKSGNPTASFQDNNNTFLIHSKYDPAKEAKRWIETINNERLGLVIFIGAGLGYQITEFLKASAGKQKVIVIEPDLEMAKRFLEQQDIAEELRKIQLFMAMGEDNELFIQLSQILSSEWIFLTPNMQFFVLPIYETLFPDFVSEIKKRLKKIILTKLFEMGNDVNDTLIGIERHCQNLQVIKKGIGIKNFRDRYKGKPAIIVSTGPSLAKNVEQLKNAVGKALIFSVDASVQVLQKHDIYHDVVTSIERIELTYEKFYQDKEMPEKSVFFAPPVVFPKIYDSFSEKYIIGFRENEAVNEWLDSIFQKGKLQLGQSSAHVAFALAKYVGADPIIFVGQDLAFGEDGATHSKDSAFESQKKNEKETVEYIEGIDGKEVLTTMVWRSFLVWFEREIGSDKSGRTYIDATEGGAKIHGTQIISLNETLDKYCNSQVEDFYEVFFQVKKSDEESEEYRLQDFAGSFGREIENFSKLQKKIKELHLEFTSNQVNRNNLEENLNYQVSKIYNEIIHSIFDNKIMLMMFQGYLFTYMNKIIKQSVVSNKEEAKVLQNSLIDFLSTLMNVFENVISQLENYYETYVFPVSAGVKDD